MEAEYPSRDPEDFGTILKEIQSADDTFTALTPSDSSIYFIYTSGNSNVLAYIDTDSTDIKFVPGATNVSSIYRFSETQDQLLIQIHDVRFSDHNGSQSERFKWLAVVNTITKSVTRVSTKAAVQEGNPIWLNNNEIIFESVSLSDLDPRKDRWHIDLRTMKIAEPAQVPGLAQYPQLNDFDYLLSSGGPGRVVLRNQGSVKLLDLETGFTSRLLPGSGEFISQPEWVNIRPRANHFLFCATPLDSTNRLLFRGQMGVSNVIKLSNCHSYNGKWLSDEKSFAFVASTNNCFFLRVVIDGRATNLFTGGWCRTFTPSPDGTRVYAEASIDSGPCGLWEFNIPLWRLRQIVPGNKIPFQKATITTPEFLRVPSFDGFEVPVYRFAARHKTDRDKLGLIIAVPPRTDQCNHYYQTRPQFLSNFGFDYYGINYRGCDGYGTASAKLYIPEIAARDVISVAKEIISRFGRPACPIFLIAQSEGGTVLERVILFDSSIWNACALVRTVPLARGSFKHLPQAIPILFVIGRNDPAYPSIQTLGDELKLQSRPVSMTIIDNYTHLNVNPLGREFEEAAVARFLLKHGP